MSTVFKVGDRVKIDMPRTAMNALNWNKQTGVITAPHTFYPNNWWVKLDMDDEPNFKGEDLIHERTI